MPTPKTSKNPMGPENMPGKQRGQGRKGKNRPAPMPNPMHPKGQKTGK